MLFLMLARPYSRVSVNPKVVVCMLRTTIPFKLVVRAFSCLENINSIIVLRD
jgi:hypothetical protein